MLSQDIVQGGHAHTAARDIAVGELIELIMAVDGVVQGQASADCSYFKLNCTRALSDTEEKKLQALFLHAYRFQYIFSGASHAEFVSVLNRLTTREQSARFFAAVDTLR